MNIELSQKKMDEFRADGFQSIRVFREFMGRLNATADVIFPLLYSVREADWLPNSNHKLIFSESGFAENGYIFQSDFFGFGLETWVRFEHIANESLAYVRCSEHLSIIFRITLRENDDNKTDITIKLNFTSLTPEGNNILLNLPEQLPLNTVVTALDHYIATGEQIGR